MGPKTNPPGTHRVGEKRQAFPSRPQEVTDVDIPPAINTYLGRMAQEFDSWDVLTAPFLSLVDSLQ